MSNIGCKILNIGSVSALNPLSKVYTYSASKAALHNLSKNLAREYGNKIILTNIDIIIWNILSLCLYISYNLLLSI